MFSSVKTKDQLQIKQNMIAWRSRRQIIIYLVYAIGIASSWPMYGLCAIIFLLALACVWSFS